ncbi:MAG: hypothetical protein ACTHK8_18905 [Ginsengibacter sp.]
MPHYRITIKLENENVKEYVIEDERKQIDFVYLDYRKRVRQKNGAGRVVYFDCVMLAEESVKNQEDRLEVYNPANNFGVQEISPFKKKHKEPRRYRNEPTVTLGERAEYLRKLNEKK